MKHRLVLFLILLNLLCTSQLYAQRSANNKNNQNFKTLIYKIGDQIASGIGQSIATGSKVNDPSLTYTVSNYNNVIFINNKQYQFVDVAVLLKSNKLQNPKITFRLILDYDNTSKTIVGTINNIMVDGKPNPGLQIMNATSYIQTKKGTALVRVLNGRLQIVN